MKAKKFVQITKNGYGEIVHQTFTQLYSDKNGSVLVIEYKGLVKIKPEYFTVLKKFKDYYLVENKYSIKLDSLILGLNYLRDIEWGIQSKLNMNNHETMG